MPSVLLDGVGPRQDTPWPLHREERVKQLAHMPRTVVDAELLLDHPGNHGRGPHTVVQSVSHRPNIQNVPQSLPLLCCQLGRLSGAVAFQRSRQGFQDPAEGGAPMQIALLAIVLRSSRVIP
jgi:hypothetical protein